MSLLTLRPVAVDFTDEQIVRHDQQRELGPDGDAQLALLFAEVFPANEPVLDVGGGSGTALPQLTRAGLQVVLMDVSSAMLSAGSCRGVPRVQADLRALPLPDRSVGGVHAAFVLQNIPEWTRAVAEIARVLLPTGTVLVAWGQSATDAVAAAVRDHLLRALQETGAAVGVAAAAAGLDTVDDGHVAFTRNGLAIRSEHRVTGRQTRSIRQLAVIRANNPFMSEATHQQRREAVQRTLSWAASTLGDIDAARSISAELLLYRYRR